MTKITACCLLTFLSCALATPSNTKTLSTTLEGVIPAVVNIKSEGKLPPMVYLKDDDSEKSDDLYQKQLPEEKPFMSLGSGVVIADKKGYIVTNAHVVKDADTIVVTLQDGRHFHATLLGSDEPSDIAVIQIHAPKLTALTAANSNELKVGDTVVAIGNPFGLGETVTSGIVSALERSNLQLEGYENFIQIDAPINFGNSGGALINEDGELVGINTAMLSPNSGSIGIGFAIPSNMVMEVAKQLVQYGKVERGILGVMVQTVSPAIASAIGLENTKGAIVTQVIPNSPAEQAGIQVGDVITTINGNDISTSSQLVNTVGFIRTGTKVHFEALRQGKTIQLTPTVIDKEKQQEISQSARPFLYGIGLQNTTQYIPGQGDISGVMVTGVTQSSNAWSAGLRPGDTITSANGVPSPTISSLETTAKSTKKKLLLSVIRENSTIYIVIPKDLQ